MSRLPQQTPRERRTWWLSLAALVVVLPLAVAFRSYGSAVAWRSAQELDPTVAAAGGTAFYAGAEWRLGGLYKLQETGSSSAIILAEFEATVSDPAAFAAGACSVVLTDAARRRWQPLFLMPQAIRKARPEVADKPTCSSASLAPAAPGQRIVMAEAFMTPEEIADFDLVISLAQQRPAYLILE